ncbi:MAG TPA: tetratricopeptide repeat protein, partial [Pirellulaceae bacterium]|nr:tetratricopeptide repeat protein [Pirellulaceae bacterium]
MTVSRTLRFSSAPLIAALALWAAAPSPAAEPLAPNRLEQLLAEAARLDAAGKLAESLPLRKEIVELAVKQHGADSLDAAHALAALAHNYRRREAFAEAEELARQALAIFQQKLGEKDLQTINTYGQLVDILNHAKKFKEAEPLGRKLVALRKEILGADQAATAESYVMLGGTLFFLEQGAEAAALHQRAFEIFSARLGPDDERTRRAEGSCADSLNVEIQRRYLAAMKRHPGDDLAAQYETFEGMLDVMRQVFPPERHPHGSRRTARILMRLGELRAGQGRHAEARPWLEKALAMQEKLLLAEYPEGHPELIVTHSRLSKTLHSHGEYKQASAHARQALTMARACYPTSEY